MDVTFKSDKGYAFINFDTVEKAVALMDAFGGSCGDPDEPQLIVNNRAVRLAFSREKRPPPSSEKKSKIWKDWICPKCKTTNFARRVKCFGCGAPKAEDAAVVLATVAAESKPTESTQPTNSIVVRNMKLNTTEETVHKVLSNFAPVKEVRLVRDRATNQSRGFAFVDFYTIEQAEHCIKCASTNKIRIDDVVVTLNFSRERKLGRDFHTTTTSVPVPPRHPPPQQLLEENNSTSLDAATIEAYRKRKEQKKYSKFPSPFELAGTDYTLDPNTGQYYEATHGFYFDPKTRYYFSVTEQTYYVYDNVSKTFSPVTSTSSSSSSSMDSTALAWQAVFDQNTQQYYYYNSITQATSWTCPAEFNNSMCVAAPVVAVAPLPGVIATDVTNTTTNVVNTNTTEVISSTFGLDKESKNMVAKKKRGPVTKLSIFNNNNKNEEEEEKTEEELQALLLQAQRAQGQSRLQERRERQRQVQKTKDRQEEVAREKREKLDMLKRIQEEKERLRKLVASEKVTKTPAVSSSAAAAVKKFVCWVCRRSFKSDEMLKRHESESELHKKNLEKQKKDGSSKYVDRAAQRRKMYGQPNRPPVISRKRAHPTSSSSASSTFMTQPQSRKKIEQKEISDNNVGRKMLERIGWKKGEGLGKQKNGIKAPINHEKIGGKIHHSDMRGVGSSNHSRNRKRRRK